MPLLPLVAGGCAGCASTAVVAAVTVSVAAAATDAAVPPVGRLGGCARRAVTTTAVAVFVISTAVAAAAASATVGAPWALLSATAAAAAAWRPGGSWVAAVLLQTFARVVGSAGGAAAAAQPGEPSCGLGDGRCALRRRWPLVGGAGTACTVAVLRACAAGPRAFAVSRAAGCAPLLVPATLTAAAAATAHGCVGAVDTRCGARGARGGPFLPAGDAWCKKTSRRRCRVRPLSCFSSRPHPYRSLP